MVIDRRHEPMLGADYRQPLRLPFRLVWYLKNRRVKTYDALELERFFHYLNHGHNEPGVMRQMKEDKERVQPVSEERMGRASDFGPTNEDSAGSPFVYPSRHEGAGVPSSHLQHVIKRYQLALVWMTFGLIVLGVFADRSENELQRMRLENAALRAEFQASQKSFGDAWRQYIEARDKLEAQQSRERPHPVGGVTAHKPRF